MYQTEIIIRHKEGVHTRPASVFVREAGKFKCEISLTVETVTVNGKSIMGLLMLAMGQGTHVIISAEGTDEIQAVEHLASVLSGDF
jgi:phosphocarrier protein HPr